MWMSWEADSPLGEPPDVNAAELTALEPWAQEPGKWCMIADPCKLWGNTCQLLLVTKSLIISYTEIVN